MESIENMHNLAKEFKLDSEQGHSWNFFSNIVKDLTSKKNAEEHDSPFYDLPAENQPEVDEEATSIPTVVFHGLGDACINPGMIGFMNKIGKGTQGVVKCIEVGMPSFGEVFNNFETIAEISCKKVAEDSTFSGEFNVVGLSQGGLLARYMVEECEMPGKVRNMVTLGGPHMGVDAVPNCLSGVACAAVNFIAKHLIYFGFMQNWVAPAGYFRDVNNYKTYLDYSVFLPTLNNEHTKGRGSLSQLKKEKFSALNGALLVMFDADTVVYPKETAWF